jgi:crossover junction endodeoxyribonuclease RusA
VSVVTEARILAIALTVYGSPAPQGSKSFKGFRGGKAIMVESSKHLRPWRDAVRADAITARQALDSWQVLDEPLVAEMVFTLPKPASAPKTRRIWPMRMPDLSKLCRSTEDSLKDAGIYKDDARIIGYTKLFKVFPGEDIDALDSPGAVIRIYRLVES